MLKSLTARKTRFFSRPFLPTLQDSESGEDQLIAQILCDLFPAVDFEQELWATVCEFA